MRKESFTWRAAKRPPVSLEKQQISTSGKTMFRVDGFLVEVNLTALRGGTVMLDEDMSNIAVRLQWGICGKTLKIAKEA